MEKKTIELTKINYECDCIMCCREEATTKVNIQRLRYYDNIISFHVCDKCLAKMQEDIQKICE